MWAGFIPHSPLWQVLIRTAFFKAWCLNSVLKDIEVSTERTGINRAC